MAKRSVIIAAARERLQRKVEELRDLQADVRRAIDVWEHMGFDASEGWDRYGNLSWEIAECLDWIDEHSND